MAESAENTRTPAHAAPVDPHADSHGHSTAAWTGVLIMIVASALISLGMVLGIHVLWIVGTLAFIGGVVAWIVMNKAGYGDGGPKNTMGH
ncbi:multisubunit Na+/H+ antiporter MnhG subunit [Kineosphaera limosa]|uniref:Uncharacterized protein n=1 Tax=Kineosphaera limosa NBRC 100340 TaxID=1184609 RepID=K6X6G5_9MICO|nr:HGxxPAAW family protein [Kineosphaera limosa]NYE03052.1 multisubunit Na+/H+ antiporter MnhG subunit [Kineosphaera limosa]GAB94389.1 hypothetical protein KILIM_005_00070 [Kineosphaera limosa NBRC 100340]